MCSFLSVLAGNFFAHFGWLMNIKKLSCSQALRNYSAQCSVQGKVLHITNRVSRVGGR